MKLKSWLKQWKLEKLKIKAAYLEAEISFNDTDKKAAWELYIELLTRITTQHLEPADGDEQTALNSVFSLFKTTRDILKKYGPDCVNFSKIAVVVLNQKIRPFTAKWHKKSLAGAFDMEVDRKLFRSELKKLQKELRKYTLALSQIAEVEDLTDLEQV